MKHSNYILSLISIQYVIFKVGFRMGLNFHLINEFESKQDNSSLEY